MDRIITLPAPGRTGHVVAIHARLSNAVTRTAPENPIILIPARLAARRLPGKPLADIAGTPMIVHVWRRAIAAEVGPVVVACGDRAIADVVEAAGGGGGASPPPPPSRRT